MIKQLFFGFSIVATALMACACSSTAPLSTPEAQKAFAGGPMPPEARAAFEASQKQSAQRIAAQVRAGTFVKS